jgi:hypothetical protein
MKARGARVCAGSRHGGSEEVSTLVRERPVEDCRLRVRSARSHCAAHGLAAQRMVWLRSAWSGCATHGRAAQHTALPRSPAHRALHAGLTSSTKTRCPDVGVRANHRQSGLMSSPDSDVTTSSAAAQRTPCIMRSMVFETANNTTEAAPAITTNSMKKSYSVTISAPTNNFGLRTS